MNCSYHTRRGFEAKLWTHGLGKGELFVSIALRNPEEVSSDMSFFFTTEVELQALARAVEEGLVWFRSQDCSPRGLDLSNESPSFVALKKEISRADARELYPDQYTPPGCCPKMELPPTSDPPAGDSFWTSPEGRSFLLRQPLPPTSRVEGEPVVLEQDDEGEDEWVTAYNEGEEYDYRSQFGI